MFDRFDILGAYNVYSTLWLGDKYANAIQCRIAALDTNNIETSPENLSENGQEIYLALVTREQGEDVGKQTRMELQPDIADLVVRLVTSDYDPFQITAEVSGPSAHMWADMDQCIEGSNWETARDMPEYAYTIINWDPELVSRLVKQGYRLDMSEFCDPDSEQLAIAEHASECSKCSWDYNAAVKHLGK